MAELVFLESWYPSFGLFSYVPVMSFGALFFCKPTACMYISSRGGRERREGEGTAWPKQPERTPQFVSKDLFTCTVPSGPAYLRDVKPSAYLSTSSPTSTHEHLSFHQARGMEPHHVSGWGLPASRFVRIGDDWMCGGIGNGGYGRVGGKKNADNMAGVSAHISMYVFANTVGPFERNGQRVLPRGARTSFPHESGFLLDPRQMRALCCSWRADMHICMIFFEILTRHKHTTVCRREL